MWGTMQDNRIRGQDRQLQQEQAVRTRSIRRTGEGTCWGLQERALKITGILKEKNGLMPHCDSAPFCHSALLQMHQDSWRGTHTATQQNSPANSNHVISDHILSLLIWRWQVSKAASHLICLWDIALPWEALRPQELNTNPQGCVTIMLPPTGVLQEAELTIKTESSVIRVRSFLSSGCRRLSILLSMRKPLKRNHRRAWECRLRTSIHISNVEPSLLSG